MALPSSVTLGSVALVVAAGVGLVAVASNASEAPPQRVADHQDTVAKPQQRQRAARHEPAKQHQHHRRSPAKHHRAAVPKVFVEVYNNSGISRLAADKAHVLEQSGWNVTATDNWYGNIPDNTVYFPGSLRPQARRLAHVLHITRLRPAVSPMQFDRLTVILTSPR